MNDLNKFDTIESYFNNTSQHSTFARKALDDLRAEHAALVVVEEQFDSILAQLDSFGMVVPPNAVKAQSDLAAVRAGSEVAK